MSQWTEKSIDLANQRNYLDLLYKVYPMSVNARRDLPDETITQIKKYLNQRQNDKLVELLLNQEIFPIKDSYVAYLKRDKSSLKRNPHTVERLAGMLYEMGFSEIIDKTTQPKETNRQIGPMFNNWIASGALGVTLTSSHSTFLTSQNNMVLLTSDADKSLFAKKHLGYNHDKGLDFIGKFNNNYVVAEAKFLTDFGGHQNAQFNDAINTMTSKFNSVHKVIPISILDGVLYIRSDNKMYKAITNTYKDYYILSAVLLRDFLFSL